MIGIPDSYSVRQLERYVIRASGVGRVKVVDGTRAPPPYPLASLFLLPSRSENFGLTVAEAMSYAVPVIVTNTTPWQDLPRRGAGWCVPWESFGTALKEAFAESTELLADRGWTGRRYVSRLLGWEIPAARLTDFYIKLVADFAKKRP